MIKKAHERVALAAARFLADGTESEYLQAKHRALMSLGLSDQTRLPANRIIKDMIGQLVKAELGDSEVARRLGEMRAIAFELMTLIDDYDPFLIGSTLSGKIRVASDIDLHAYADDYEELMTLLSDCGYPDVDAEVTENRKGEFVHLRWQEDDYPVEITVYPWSWRHLIMYSSVTGKPMKRADRAAVRRLLGPDYKYGCDRCSSVLNPAE